MSTNKLYSFGDDASAPVRSGRRPRRGRGSAPTNRQNAAAPGNRNAAANANNGSRPQNRNNSGAVPASNVRRPGAEHAAIGTHRHHPQRQTSPPPPPPQANFVTSDAWNSPIKGNNNDDNDGTGSLTYSASSSVHSAESSNDSSFSAILKALDSSSEGENLVFQAAPGGMGQTQYGRMKGMGMEVDNNNAAVAGWNQRRGQQLQTAPQLAPKAPQVHPQQVNKHQYSMARETQTSEHVDLNYSKDDSSEEDVCGVKFNEQEESVLETIAGKQEEEIFSAKPQATFNIAPSLRDSSPYHASTPHNSAPSSPRSPCHVTPPPHARQQRTSTPPGAAPLSRTSSRQSKSSSDGSFDTPAPSTPPHHTDAHSKPPHARGAPAHGSRRKSGEGEEQLVEDLSEAFYAKSWMCGFTDAFNF